jgi:hypothetical protein
MNRKLFCDVRRLDDDRGEYLIFQHALGGEGSTALFRALDPSYTISSGFSINGSHRGGSRGNVSWGKKDAGVAHDFCETYNRGGDNQAPPHHLLNGREACGFFGPRRHHDSVNLI